MFSDIMVNFAQNSLCTFIFMEKTVLSILAERLLRVYIDNWPTIGLVGYISVCINCE
jgi:hypothetical protein